MTRAFWMTIGVGLSVAVAGVAQPPGPMPPVSPAPPPAPWANKFFLPDIAANREQPAPPFITHNFGDVPHGTLCVHKFTVTNIYDVPMQIIEVRKSCTCLDYVPLSKVLQPNEAGELTVTMNTGKFVGFNAQTFYVTFGPKFSSTAVIRVQANSRTEVTVNPGAVEFGTVAQGAKPVQAVTLAYTGKTRDWRVTEVVPPAGPLDVKVTEASRGGPLRGGAEYRVEVTLKSNAPAGPISEQITLKTNDPTNPLVQIAVRGSSVAPLDLIPNRVAFPGAVSVGKSLSFRVLVRAAKPFKIVGVEGEGQGLTVELPTTAAALPVQVITVKFEPTVPGTLTRELRIKTDLDGGATAVLPVEAEGVN